MRKNNILSFCLFILFCTKIFATTEFDNIVDADLAISNFNYKKLELIYKNNPENNTVSYMYAKTQLSLENTSPAQKFVETQAASFMRNDLIHQLLIFYFNKQQFIAYKKYFELLTPNLALTNEKCGYDEANIVLKMPIKLLSNLNNLLVNNTTPWCISLLAIQAKNKAFTPQQKDMMFYTLLINGKTDAFNQMSAYLQLPTINFNYYKNKNVSALKANRFLMAQHIIKTAKSDPDRALSELKSSYLTNQAKQVLFNYIALQFALNLNFAEAIDLFNHSDSSFMSNEEHEWQVRSYLFFANWQKVIASINKMPNDLKDKSVWLYWKAKAFDSIGESSMANNLLEKIPYDYSYYSMLAQSELDNNILFKPLPLQSPLIKSKDLLKQVNYVINLYLAGRQYNRRGLITIAVAQWFFLIRQAKEEDLLAMSLLARDNHLFDLSIYAANKLYINYLSLSFPTPFIKYFQEYGDMYEIDPAYILGISRQESRFNATVIAFDGGVGLMQIMPLTGQYIAQKIHSANCYRLSPKCNIQFGSWYLGNLYKKFNGNLIYSTASYNAGPTRPLRWQGKLNRIDNKIQIELIPISVTRDYVQKVLTNKAIYDTIFTKANINKINLFNYINAINNKSLKNPFQDDDHTDASKINMN